MSNLQCGEVGIAVELPSMVPHHATVASIIAKKIERMEINNGGALYGTAEEIEALGPDFRGSGEFANYLLRVCYDGNLLDGEVVNKRTCETLFKYRHEAGRVVALNDPLLCPQRRRNHRSARPSRLVLSRRRLCARFIARS